MWLFGTVDTPPLRKATREVPTTRRSAFNRPELSGVEVADRDPFDGVRDEQASLALGVARRCLERDTGREGIEPPTVWLKARRSAGLSYRPSIRTYHGY